MRVVAAALLLLSPALASADAIIPLAEPCGPGADVRIRHHAETCVPRLCEDDAVCGEGARCGEVCLCQVEREVRSDGRIVYPEPRMVQTTVGACDANGACAEGEPLRRRQCEAIEDGPADAPPEEPADPPGEEPTEEPADPPGQSSPGGGCAGCAVPRGGADAPLGAIALLALALLRRR